MQNLKNLSKEDIQLIEIAGQHAKKLYKKDVISIGAALRSKSGKIFTGINLKYHVRNTSMCGEMLAIYKALDEGETELDTIVGVRYAPETDLFSVVNGCGKCRQLFCQNTPLKVIINNKGVLEVKQAEELLPFAFV